MKSKKKYFNSLFAFLPVSFLVTSSCAENFIHSKMDSVSTKPSCSGSFTDISPKDRSIKNKSEQPYEEIIEWFKGRKLIIQQYYSLIMSDILPVNIDKKAKVRLVSALCAAYPNYLSQVPSQCQRQYRIAEKIINLLLNYKGGDYTYAHEKDIIESLIKCELNAINFRNC